MQHWRPYQRVLLISLAAFLNVVCVVAGCTFLVGGIIRLRGESISMTGPSMEPTIQSGTVMPLHDVGSAGPQRGDIVVFHPPIDPSELYVKRVIALPGDIIAITEAGVTLNGQVLAEPYVDRKNWVDRTILFAMTMRSGQYFVMGDNRDNSFDSRMFGAIDRSSMLGKVALSGG